MRVDLENRCQSLMEELEFRKNMFEEVSGLFSVLVHLTLDRCYILWHSHTCIHSRTIALDQTCKTLVAVKTSLLSLSLC